MYTVLVDRERFGLDSRALLRELERAHIQARPLWQPAHLSPSQRGASPAACPVAERLNRDPLSLPCSVGLSAQDQETVIRYVSRAATPPTGRPRAG
ncbi:MAG: DegT/DnrJ/EryC1/StrS family aminotransferase, partial [Gemmatimonadales bacterium]